MSSITIRNLDSAIKERLRVRAAQHGHSMKAEARRILQSALSAPAKTPARSFYDRVHDRFAAIGGVELELPLYSAERSENSKQQLAPSDKTTELNGTGEEIEAGLAVGQGIGTGKSARSCVLSGPPKKQ